MISIANIAISSSKILIIICMSVIRLVKLLKNKKSRLKANFKRDLLFLISVIPSGFEPEAYCLEGSCSIQLSYGTDLSFL